MLRKNKETPQNYGQKILSSLPLKSEAKKKRKKKKVRKEVIKEGDRICEAAIKGLKIFGTHRPRRGRLWRRSRGKSLDQSQVQS